MTAFNFACYKKDSLGRTHLCDGSAMGSINSYNKPLSNNLGTEDGYNENDSDSETFWLFGIQKILFRYYFLSVFWFCFFFEDSLNPTAIFLTMTLDK